MSDTDTTLPPGDQPQAPAQEAGTATVGESAAAAAVAAGTTTTEQSSTSSSATAPSEASSSGAATTASTIPTSAEDPNAGATPAGNASEGAAQSSVPPASADAGASPTGASSPASTLPGQVAQHLEAVYQTVVDHTAAAFDLKAHIGEVLHMIQNGIDVRTGTLVQKLEALFHKL